MKEWLGLFRPFELFTECYGYEISMDSLEPITTDELLQEYYRLQEQWEMFYDEIEERGLKVKYFEFVKYIKESGIDGR